MAGAYRRDLGRVFNEVPELSDEGTHVIPAWFIGMNPQLDDDSPAEPIREGKAQGRECWALFDDEDLEIEVIEAMPVTGHAGLAGSRSSLRTSDLLRSPICTLKSSGLL